MSLAQHFANFESQAIRPAAVALRADIQLAVSRYDKYQLATSVEIHEGEENDRWTPIPPWVQWFLDFGYAFPVSSERRTLTIISLPCECPAAGLIALGLVRRRLESTWGDDEAGHHARLIRLAQSGRRVEVKPVRSQTKHVLLPFFGPPLKAQCIGGKQRDQIQFIFPYTALDWQIGDEPPVVSRKGSSREYEALFDELFPSAQPVLRDNLARSDASVCLVAKSEGQSVTERALANFHFRSGAVERTLAALLLPDGARSTVARMSLFSSRKGDFAWASRRPDIAVCDGSKAFLRTVDGKDMKGSNVIAVVNRVCSSDDTEELINDLRAKEQWFSQTELGANRRLPGVAVTHLQQRP